jgi:Putative beta-barrel porin-2, OmpL-like. bbp2
MDFIPGVESLKKLMSISRKLCVHLSVLGLVFGALCCAQDPPTNGNGNGNSVDQKPAPAAATPPAALPTPSFTGPLQNLPPATFDAGPFGQLAVNGIFSGMGLWQSNPLSGDEPTQAALSNGQIFIQKTDGWFQFYLQAGAYTISELSLPFLPVDLTLTDFWGPVPVAYLKLVPSKNTSILIGALPTLIGAEYTFSFQNMNVERGLLWNQENAVNRGIQINQTFGKFTASLAWSDGFYSNRYSWLTGSLTYANGHHALAFVGGGNLGQTKFQTLATPVQNNGRIYNVIYTYTNGPWIFQPYFQRTNVPTNSSIGITKGSSSTGGAVLLSHSFGRGFSLAGRWEYIATGGSQTDGSVNLMFGPGSTGTSVTLTPTFQYGGFFFRGDLSWVHAGDYMPSLAFGRSGTNQDQPRAVAEIGFIFGNNLSGKKP